MDVPELVRQAQTHLANASEQAKQVLANEHILYMWDNQISAIDNFLADTEEVADAVLQTWRGKLRDVKKQLTDAVMAFEAKAAGEDLPPEDEQPSPEEWADSFAEMAPDMTNLVREALEEKVADVKDLIKWQDPLEVINGYLADSEPYQEASAELQKVRSVVRAAKKDLDGRIKDVFAKWREEDMKAS